MELNVQSVLKWIEKLNDKIQNNKEYLTSLDQAIGDGDHGINMARGFQEVINKTTTSQYDTVSDLTKDVAMTLMSKVGGASGPLYGTAFLKLSMSVKGKDPVDHDAFTAGVQEALNGIQQRGKANEGEKTLVDVWAPVLRFLQENSEFEPGKLEETAKVAMESTKDIIAIRGRAAYLKERSKGHLDPGSVSSFYLFQSLAEVLQEGE
ncbi:dihydroxyacetone kinase subunit DhaL [Aquibacillus sp. 3ASR75-11]|uniref:phosphoenolpyruvate--glycerone phosphotransferase n=1 Tax=Terrihalobacillus insolitus TaxID=2950438 RepID=A0A9X4AM54_9BACI|nr:dihydroxyacetone kinase subunit DhaL [Terrihalobacillus insolitus]MDC3412147.1 dihydroxyacetone kinase subunit DhaL [Terrihalobacillus insolitus]MDC3423160.1 dihydroxyacetone kinase subunit DhaL [Terrihalobacillus insolitus]